MRVSVRTSLVNARVLVVTALVVAAALPACKGCGEGGGAGADGGSASTSVGNGGSGAGLPSTAEIRWRDGGASPDLVSGAVVFAIPYGELTAGARPAVVRDEAGKRLAYPTASGDVRVIYLVGDHAWLGPKVRAPIDFRAAPDPDAALGALFVSAGARRAELASDVTKEKGEAGIVRMLVDGGSADGPEWEAALAKLPEGRAAEVKAALAARLETGKPTAGLRRAVTFAPLADPSRTPALAARLRELAAPPGLREPRAAAAMLRAVAVNDKTLAATIGCEVLGRSPLETKAETASPEEIDRPGREALVEAALLAIAAAGPSASGACAKVEGSLGEDHCLTSFRCGPGGPVDPAAATKQDEPLCTKADLAKVIAAELARKPDDVVGLGKGTRAELFAYAALLEASKVPEVFTTAHARRRYAVAQPKAPPCDTGMAPGTPCNCDEATLRDQTCRHPQSSSVSVGVCKFDVDDKQKKITNVVATAPP